MTDLIFSQDMALALLGSEDKHPVDFEDAWQWLGYATKQKAQLKLTRNFVEGKDFLTKGLKSSQGGRPSVSIKLTVDCFKSFGMLAGTEQGKKIRNYFLDCEQVAKATAKSDRMSELKLEAEISHIQHATVASKLRLMELTMAVCQGMSTQAAMWMRGEGPPPEIERPTETVYVTEDGKKLGATARGRSLTQLLRDAGLNPKSKKDQAKVKAILKDKTKIDFETGEGLETASYMSEHKVIPQDEYEVALQSVISEIAPQNLFVNHFTKKQIGGSKVQPVLKSEG